MSRRLSIFVFSVLLAIWAIPILEGDAVAPETLLDAIKQGKSMTHYRLR